MNMKILVFWMIMEIVTPRAYHITKPAKKRGNSAPAKGKDGDGNRPIIKFASVNNFKKRIFISNTDMNEYTIKLTVNQNIDDCRLQVFISGETSNIDADIISAYSDSKN